MSYPGGKGGAGVYQQIINQIPPHEVYVEAFLGGGSILLSKKRAPASYGIDLDPAAIQKFNSMHSVEDLTLINGDAISWLVQASRRMDRSWFVYCDPPYLLETRSHKKSIYRFEFGMPSQHERLLAVLNKLPCMVAVSGYYSSLYNCYLGSWRSISFNSVVRSGAVRREWLWMNYPVPDRLHDYRYLGDNFRQRERIKRIKTRWLARMRRMPALERYAILGAFEEFTDVVIDKNIER